MLVRDPALAGRRLYLMRHGQTYEPRLDAPMAGAAEDPELPLTEAGRAGVVATAAAMQHLGLDAVHSSTFLRSRETARIVGEPHGLAPTTFPELTELRVYPEGGTLRDVARRYLAIARELAAKPAQDVRLDCGRSVAEILDGAHAALHRILGGEARRALVVAHGGINRLLLTSLLGLPLERFLAVDQDFACVNVIDFVQGGYAIVRAINVTPRDLFKAAEAPA
ncbi:MAG TPA: histidine phosphatase family protein [Myxococcota bacterium]|nr:histidine phosphatase family protein [Myxococcota bacterium]